MLKEDPTERISPGEVLQYMEEEYENSDNEDEYEENTFKHYQKPANHLFA